MTSKCDHRMGFGIYEQMGRTPDENECPACGLTEAAYNEQVVLAAQRADALQRVRKEVDELDAEIADLLMRRMARARYARCMHPEYVDDYDRELVIMKRYTKKLCPWTKPEVVADLCMALFRMSRP